MATDATAKEGKPVAPKADVVQQLRGVGHARRNQRDAGPGAPAALGLAGRLLSAGRPGGADPDDDIEHVFSQRSYRVPNNINSLARDNRKWFICLYVDHRRDRLKEFAAAGEKLRRDAGETQDLGSSLLSIVKYQGQAYPAKGTWTPQTDARSRANAPVSSGNVLKKTTVADSAKGQIRGMFHGVEGRRVDGRVHQQSRHLREREPESGLLAAAGMCAIEASDRGAAQPLLRGASAPRAWFGSDAVATECRTAVLLPGMAPGWPQATLGCCGRPMAAPIANKQRCYSGQVLWPTSVLQSSQEGGGGGLSNKGSLTRPRRPLGATSLAEPGNDRPRDRRVGFGKGLAAANSIDAVLFEQRARANVRFELARLDVFHSGGVQTPVPARALHLCTEYGAIVPSGVPHRCDSVFSGPKGLSGVDTRRARLARVQSRSERWWRRLNREPQHIPFRGAAGRQPHESGHGARSQR